MGSKFIFWLERLIKKAHRTFLRWALFIEGLYPQGVPSRVGNTGFEPATPTLSR